MTPLIPPNADLWHHSSTHDAATLLSAYSEATMERFLAASLILTVATGRVAVSALKHRKEIRRQALWIEAQCPDARRQFSGSEGSD